MEITKWTFEAVFLRLLLLPIIFFNTVSCCIWHVIIRIYSLAVIVKCINFSQIMYNDFTQFSIVQTMYENYYHEQLAKISTFVKYLTDAYHWYILPFCFVNLNSCDYHGDSLGVLFCWFSVSYHFPWCFQMFFPVFLRFPLVFLLFFHSVSPVSYCRFCMEAVLVSFF